MRATVMAFDAIAPDLARGSACAVTAAILSVALALAAARLYDEPVRAWLTAAVKRTGERVRL